MENRPRRWGRNVARVVEPVFRLAEHGLKAAGGYGGYQYFKGKRSAPVYEPRAIAPSRKRGRIPRKVKGIQKQVKELKRIAESDMGTHIERERTTGRVLAGVNAMGLAGFNAMTTATIERCLNKLKYYDIATPETLVVAAANLGTYTKDFYISRTYSKITVRNNYQVPCKVKVFVCVPKVDTAINAETAFTNGLTDSGNPTATSPLVQLTDSQQFNDLYRIEKSKSVLMEAGDECVMSYGFKPFLYDPALVDSQTQTYQVRYGTCIFVVRIEGVLGHDTVVTTEQSTLQVGVDVMYETMIECKYAAGIDLYTVSIVNNADTSFTNAGVVSAKPLVDNQSYSLA